MIHFSESVHADASSKWTDSNNESQHVFILGNIVLLLLFNVLFDVN